MSSQWVVDEMQSADLRDKRLERRLIGLIETLSEASNASIPAACRDHAEMTAAYRFFDNEKVNFENVLQPHIDASYGRVANEKVALLVQDTTEIDLTRPDSQVVGAGPLNHAKKQGMLLHLLHAFATDGTPLGTMSAEAWTREPKDHKPKAKRGSSEKRVQIARKPFEEKETVRWLQFAEHCEEIQEHCPETQLVMLADRECDITEVIDYCTGQDRFDWVIRSDVDRVLNKSRKQDASVKVRDQLGSTKPLYRQQLSIRSREQWGSQSLKQRPGKADRDARLVNVSVHAGEVTLNDPRVGHRDGVRVSAVLVQEVDPPKRVQPVQWLLLTSLPVKTRKQVERVVAYYLMRWMIELLFKVLKSGCKIESRRFEHIDRVLPALALYLIIAWRSFYVCRVSRAHGSEPCELVFGEAEWKSVWQMTQGTTPPRKAPSLMKMTKLIAGLGGYVDRKNSGPPGPQSTWLGLQVMHIMAKCWLIFGPGAD